MAGGFWRKGVWKIYVFKKDREKVGLVKDISIRTENSSLSLKHFLFQIFGLVVSFWKLQVGENKKNLLALTYIPAFKNPPRLYILKK